MLQIDTLLNILSLDFYTITKDILFNPIKFRLTLFIHPNKIVKYSKESKQDKQ